MASIAIVTSVDRPVSALMAGSHPAGFGEVIEGSLMVCRWEVGVLGDRLVQLVGYHPCDGVNRLVAIHTLRPEARQRPPHGRRIVRAICRLDDRIIRKPAGSFADDFEIAEALTSFVTSRTPDQDSAKYTIISILI